MKRYLAYFKYVIRHRWFVFLECCRMGIWRRGLIHDLSKFLPDEFIPYAKYFYNKDGSSRQGEIRDDTGYYKPWDTGDLKFDFAWLLHQKRNKHHWQWWIIPKDDGRFSAFEMPLKYLLEMICDWKGAGKAQNVNNLKGWYDKNKEKLILHPQTKKTLEIFMFLIEDIPISLQRYLKHLKCYESQLKKMRRK